MDIQILLLLLSVVVPTAFSSSFCPESCSCPVKSEAHCSSLEFAKKIHLKTGFNFLLKLDVSNATVTKLNVNLNMFPNLKYLNLSWNKIQHISPPYLPKRLEVLDLSHNYIKYLPRNLHMLPNLKEVFLNGNPAYCDCDSASVFDELLKYDITVHSPKCDGPKEYKGIFLRTFKCDDHLFEYMQGDEPYEGSGSEDSPGEEIEEEFIIHDVTPEPHEKSEAVKVEDEEEGSGKGVDELPHVPDDYEDGSSPTTDEYDYSSNDNATDVVAPEIEAPVNKSKLESVFVKPCNFDCSTPLPLDNGEETGESPSPNLVDGLKIIANDLGIIEEPRNETDTETTRVEITAAPEHENATDGAIITEASLNSDEKSGKISAVGDASHTSFIFLGLFLLLVIVGVVYVTYKRVNVRRNQRATPTSAVEKDALPEEVELLTKPPVEDGNQNGKPEGVPLINGNKDSKDDNMNGKSNTDEVELRKPPRKSPPQPPSEATKRVTIKAGEIPDSTPKTPILVTRHLNSDGNIVTTPNVD